MYKADLLLTVLRDIQKRLSSIEFYVRQLYDQSLDYITSIDSSTAISHDVPISEVVSYIYTVYGPEYAANFTEWCHKAKIGQSISIEDLTRVIVDYLQYMEPEGDTND